MGCRSAKVWVLAALAWLSALPGGAALAPPDQEPFPSLALLPQPPTGAVDVDETLEEWRDAGLAAADALPTTLHRLQAAGEGAADAVPRPLSDATLPPEFPDGSVVLDATLDELGDAPVPPTGLVVDLPSAPGVLQAVPEPETPLDPTLRDWGLDHAEPLGVMDAAVRHAEDAAALLARAAANAPAVVVAVPGAPGGVAAPPGAEPLVVPAAVEADPSATAEPVQAAMEEVRRLYETLPRGSLERLYDDSPTVALAGSWASAPVPGAGAGAAGASGPEWLTAAVRAGAAEAASMPRPAAGPPPVGGVAWSAGVAATAGAAEMGPISKVALLLAAGAAALLAFARPLLALYHRLAPSRLLDQPTRRRIYEAISAEPGLRVGTLQARLGLNYNTVLRHVRALERGGFVEGVGPGQRRWFAKRATLDAAGKAMAVAASAPAARKVLDYLGARRVAELAALRRDLGLPRSTAGEAVARLAQAGLVQVEREGARVRVQLATAP